MKKLIVVGVDGNMQCLYDDSIHAMGRVKAVSRASQVEPNSEGGWDVVLSDDPRNKEFKGVHVGTFPRRQTALDAEVEFINSKILGEIHGSR